MSSIRHLASLIGPEIKRPRLSISNTPDCQILRSFKMITRRPVIVETRPDVRIINRRFNSRKLSFSIGRGEVTTIGQVHRPRPLVPNECAFIFPFNRWNLAGHGSITPSTEVATFPATNTYQQQRSRIWRTTSNASQYVIRDLGNAYRMNSIALVSHNMTSTATFRVRTSNDSSFSSVSYDSGTLRVWEPSFATDGPWEEEVDAQGYPSNELIELLRYCGANPRTVRWIAFNEVSARYVRIDLDDPSNTDAYIELAYLYAGLVIPISPDQLYGWNITPVGHSRIKRSASGSQWIDIFYRQLIINAEFAPQSQTNALAFWNLIASYLGKKNEFIISFQPENLGKKFWYTAYCRFQEIPQIEMLTTGTFSVPMIFEELVG